MIDEQVSDIENKALYHYKTQATVINKQDQQLVEAIKGVSSLAAEFTNMRNSDVLRHLESKRQLCQQVRVIKKKIGNFLTEKFSRMYMQGSNMNRSVKF